MLKHSCSSVTSFRNERASAYVLEIIYLKSEQTPQTFRVSTARLIADADTERENKILQIKSGGSMQCEYSAQRQNEVNDVIFLPTKNGFEVFDVHPKHKK